MTGRLDPATRTEEVLASLRHSLARSGTVTAPLPPSGPERAQALAMLQPAQPVTETDAATIVATSGSTGRPRGVVLSRTALIASAEATAARLGGHGSWVLALPVHYVAGLMVLVRSLVGDRTVHPVDGRLTGLAALVERELVGTKGPIYTALVPTQLSRALADPVLTRALAGFDAVLLGGAAADPALLDRALSAGIEIVTTYGMSETCGGCVYDGLPLDGVSVATDEQGRIGIGGPILFSGYRLDPDATADVLVDGRIRTRDRGLFVDDRLRVVGRLDDIVISGGMNVDLAAVERAVRDWVLDAWTSSATEPPTANSEPSAVTAEAAVVGIPHPEWGTEVVAVVDVDHHPPLVQASLVQTNPPGSATPTPTPTPTPGRLSLAGLREDLSTQLPHYALPRRLLLRPLPRTSGGKVDRRRLVTDLSQSAPSQPIPSQPTESK